MAVIRYHTAKEDENVPAEKGIRYWQLMTGEVDGTEAEMVLCGEIKDISLNWRNAPDSYIKARKHVIFPMVLMAWMCDANGVPTRPDPSNSFAVGFAHKWEMLLYGKIAPSMRDYLPEPRTKPWDGLFSQKQSNIN
jgi:hypothetical protein